MNAIRLAAVLSLAWLPACGEGPTPSEAPDERGDEPVIPGGDELVDTDRDGLADRAEGDLGLDAEDPDSDDDRLVDGLELEFGSDPLVADSDGDRYLDGDEVAAGSDPSDAGSVIYTGGWPYNGARPQSPDFSGGIAIGAQFPDMRGLDQNGQLVHLYDFAGLGKPVMIDFSAEWCGPCRALADYLRHGNEFFSFPEIRDAVESGEVYWITILEQNALGADPSHETSLAWATEFPHGPVPVLSVLNPDASESYIDLAAYPTLLWLDSDMRVQAHDRLDVYQAGFALEDALGD